MEINGLQIIFILIALAEWIFLGAAGVNKGLSGGWNLPGKMEEAGAAAFLGILIACYLGGRLIYRRTEKDSGAMVLRIHGGLWALFFYLPYMLFSFAEDVGEIFLNAGRVEGAMFFLAKLAAFLWLCVRLYRMPKERREGPAHESADGQILREKRGGRLLALCAFVFPVLMWADVFLSGIQNGPLPSAAAAVRLAMAAYIAVWPSRIRKRDGEEEKIP